MTSAPVQYQKSALDEAVQALGSGPAATPCPRPRSAPDPELPRLWTWRPVIQGTADLKDFQAAVEDLEPLQVIKLTQAVDPARGAQPVSQEQAQDILAELARTLDVVPAPATVPTPETIPASATTPAPAKVPVPPLTVPAPESVPQESVPTQPVASELTPARLARAAQLVQEVLQSAQTELTPPASIPVPEAVRMAQALDSLREFLAGKLGRKPARGLAPPAPSRLAELVRTHAADPAMLPATAQVLAPELEHKLNSTCLPSSQWVGACPLCC